MRNPGGHLFEFGAEGMKECDTFTCKHCQKIVLVAPREDPANLGGLCKVCMGLICPACLDHGCHPWEKQMEAMEERERKRKLNGEPKRALRPSGLRHPLQ